eukprot:GHVT01056047.1.p1 GENE.GHVT01056047.1~~GHVT01056047.1.p1  ORF type:complete len:129 (+),score=22.62 GHVT01056047.1:212-598(+)
MLLTPPLISCPYLDHHSKDWLGRCMHCLPETLPEISRATGRRGSSSSGERKPSRGPGPWHSPPTPNAQRRWPSGEISWAFSGRPSSIAPRRPPRVSGHSAGHIGKETNAAQTQREGRKTTTNTFYYYY